MPLAIINFEDSVLVASCALFLELCGFSASMLRIDIAALRRMSSFYKSSENIESLKQVSTKGSAFHAVSHGSDITESLARALADEHLHQDNSTLEKASLPPMVDGKTCGSWLLSGNGWIFVGSSIGGYPFDTVVQVASKEFSDPRLRIHISTVLKGMQLEEKLALLQISWRGHFDESKGVVLVDFGNDCIVLFRCVSNILPNSLAGNHCSKAEFKTKAASGAHLKRSVSCSNSDISNSPVGAQIFDSQDPSSKGERNVQLGESINVSSDSDEGPALLSKMVAVLCEQHLFLPLLRGI
ncbi:unnamed protein product [Prunus armeniaca]|uniref:Uncharacterized protein n=1 Tax=Prunus armeniaca TaxID=36596 RepID=A0A6J5WG34_PRUAR|nr:unnamed protein product [Prunus armeniaca]